MDTPALVASDLEAGRQLIRARDEAKIRVKAGFWYYSEDASEWRVAIVSPSATSSTRDLYEAVQRIIEARNIPLSLTRVSVMGPDSPIAQAVHEAVRTRPTEIKAADHLSISTGSSVNVLDCNVTHVYRST
jgi:hypothetical protein